MRIGICDDDGDARRMVAEWLREHGGVPGAGVHEFGGGEALLEFLRSNALDIIFLDCKMEGMDGIETAKAVRMLDSRAAIILLTDFAGYALLGYGADVLEYILKKDFALHIGKAFEKAVNRIKDGSVMTYSVKTSEGLVRVGVAEILYIESHRRKKEMVLRGGRGYAFYARLGDVEGELKQHGFIRPHNSFLVNSGHVRVFTQDSLWLSGVDRPIPVSRGRYRQAYDDMTVYAAGGRL